MASDFWVTRGHAHLDVHRCHAAGDDGHATRHQAQQFAPRHARDVRLDDQRRFGLAYENVRGSG